MSTCTCYVDYNGHVEVRGIIQGSLLIFLECCTTASLVVSAMLWTPRELADKLQAFSLSPPPYGHRHTAITDACHWICHFHTGSRSQTQPPASKAFAHWPSHWLQYWLSRYSSSGTHLPCKNWTLFLIYTARHSYFGLSKVANLKGSVLNTHLACTRSQVQELLQKTIKTKTLKDDDCDAPRRTYIHVHTESLLSTWKRKQVLTSVVAGGQETDSVVIQLLVVAKKQQALKNTHWINKVFAS